MDEKEHIRQVKELELERGAFLEVQAKSEARRESSQKSVWRALVRYGKRLFYPGLRKQAGAIGMVGTSSIGWWTEVPMQ